MVDAEDELARIALLAGLLLLAPLPAVTLPGVAEAWTALREHARRLDGWDGAA